MIIYLLINECHELWLKWRYSGVGLRKAGGSPMNATCGVSHKHVQRQEEKKVEGLNRVVYTVLLCKGEETEQGAEGG